MSRFSPSAIEARRKRAAVELNEVLSDSEAVVFFCGEPIQKPGGLDQTYSFLPHPDYQWLTGSRRAHGAVWYSKDEGWVDFVKPVTKDELLWEGGASAPSGRDISTLGEWLTKKPVIALGQVPSDHRHLSMHNTHHHVQEALHRARRIKDSEEIQLIRELASIANQGYLELRSSIRPGLSERDLQIAYESAVLRAGADKFPYDSIIGSGPNAATLHAIPTRKIIQSGELVLVDAGADIDDYCVDITRVFGVDGTLTARHQIIYDIVQNAQAASIALCKPGIHWREVHQASARVIADGLKSLGILNGSVDSLLETGAIANFFPHGVGHLVGLRVRDVGGDVTKDPTLTCGIRLRMNLTLQAGFVVTVEPGCYFVPAILNDGDRREKYKSQVNWTEAEKWADFGGIRLEDDLHIREGEAENLTQIVAK